MIVLGFDLGRYTGYAVVESDTKELLLADEIDLGEEDQHRYANFARLYRGLIAEFEPDLVGYEQVSHNTGRGNHVIQGCRGVVEAEAVLGGLLCVPVNVMTAKKHVAGTGKATKDDMRAALIHHYPEIKKIKRAEPVKRGNRDPQNATDAIAVALTAGSLVITAKEI